MPDFAYTALDTAGATVTGTLNAASRRAVIDRLASSGKAAVEVVEAAAGASVTAARRPGVSLFGGRVSGRQQAAMLRQVAVALQAGLNLLPALEAVAEQAESQALRDLVEGLASKVKEGSSLSAAMREAGPKSFSAMQVSMVEAGEAAGLLDEVAASLADFAERDLDVREKLRSAAMYPMLVLGLGSVSICVIVVFILPRIMETVNTPFEELPLPTRVLMTLSNGVRTPAGIAVILGLAVAVFLFFRWAATEDGARTTDLWKLKLPVVGSAVKKVGVARFARALGTLTGAGIQVVQASASRGTRWATGSWPSRSTPPPTPSSPARASPRRSRPAASSRRCSCRSSRWAKKPAASTSCCSAAPTPTTARPASRSTG